MPRVTCEVMRARTSRGKEARFGFCLVVVMLCLWGRVWWVEGGWGWGVDEVRLMHF